MLEDLRQFFTAEATAGFDCELSFAPESPEEFIANVIGYQVDAFEIIDYLEDEIDALSEILDNDLADFELLNVHLFNDFLDDSIYSFIFSSFLDRKEFELEVIDDLVESLYDEMNEKFIEISNKFSNKLKKYINKFYQDVKNECYYNGEYDSYSANVINLRIYHLRIKNKSLARKLRKMYTQKKYFFDMMKELDFLMINGEFIYIEACNIECEGFFNMYTDFEPISAAITALNNDLNTDRIFDDGIYFILDEAYEASTKEFDFIHRILKILDTKEEIII